LYFPGGAFSPFTVVPKKVHSRQGTSRDFPVSAKTTVKI
jgi:hypothetical protein